MYETEILGLLTFKAAICAIQRLKAHSHWCVAVRASSMCGTVRRATQRTVHPMWKKHWACIYAYNMCLVCVSHVCVFASVFCVFVAAIWRNKSLNKKKFCNYYAWKPCV